MSEYAIRIGTRLENSHLVQLAFFHLPDGYSNLDSIHYLAQDYWTITYQSKQHFNVSMYYDEVQIQLYPNKRTSIKACFVYNYISKSMPNIELNVYQVDRSTFIGLINDFSRCVELLEHWHSSKLIDYSELNLNQE